MKKLNHIEGAMRSHVLVYALIGALVAFGIYALERMNKDEFPQFTMRIGVVAAVYPGATAEEVQEQVTKPLEQYLFSFNEINKSRTYSRSRDGICYVYARLNDNIQNGTEVWQKIRGGMSLYKQTSLPQGLVAVAVIDDFGSTSSMLLSVASDERSPRELERYSDQLQMRLRSIPEMGAIRTIGRQKEEIAVTLDVQRITKYAINQNMLLLELAAQGFRTATGEVANDMGAALIHIDVPYDSEYDIGEQIIFPDPVTGQNIRLRNVATIERRYQDATKFVKIFDDNSSNEGIVISLEMTPGNNIVAFGDKVEKILREFEDTLPPDVQIYTITNQPKVVNRSVLSFLKDLLESILIVVLVMLMLFPLRTALVSSTGLPVCIAATLGIMYLFGIELNTVTLAALIVVLGMVVDDSVIVIDGYTDLLEKGHSRWYSAAKSTSALFIPMAIATCSISGMFFPMLGTLHGEMGDFVRLFPWAIFIALSCSIFYAIYVIPFMATRVIKRQKRERMLLFERVQKWFFEGLQNGYTKLLNFCFRHPWGTLGFAFLMVVLGGVFFKLNDIQFMPKAERDVFAVEIHLTEGSSLQQTQTVADSLAQILQSDKRVKSVTSFIGMGSPRFHATYAPQMAANNYAQFIVNTVSNDATAQLIEEYAPRYEDYFPNAYCRFKQLDYQIASNPVEVLVQGDDFAELEPIADSLKQFMASVPELSWVHTDCEETMQTIRIRLKDDEAARLGVTQATLSLYLNGALRGRGLTSIWENGYKTPVMLYTLGTAGMSYEDIADMLIPTPLPDTWVTLRQVADIMPDFRPAQLTTRNGIPTITISADMVGNATQPRAMKKVMRYVDQMTLPEGVSISYGGLTELNKRIMPDIVMTVLMALLVLLALLVYHFKKISISLLSLSVSGLCLFGAFFGLWLFHLNVSITAVLGLISLIGIIVRNAIIMYEYADELVHKEHMTSRDAAYQAGLRRMRPIFLTSATTALGVVPMILAATSLWMPMGVVICFGTIFTLPLVVVILPIAYWKVYERETRRNERYKAIETAWGDHVERRELQIEQGNAELDRLMQKAKERKQK